MTIEEFQAQAPAVAEAFARICYADDDRLIQMGLISAPRRSLHDPSLWTYEHVGDVWRCTGTWGEVWEHRADDTWCCTQEVKFPDVFI